LKSYEKHLDEISLLTNRGAARGVSPHPKKPDFHDFSILLETKAKECFFYPYLFPQHVDLS